MIPTSLLFIYERSDGRVRRNGTGEEFTERARAIVVGLLGNPNLTPSQVFTTLTSLHDFMRDRGRLAGREPIYALEAAVTNPAWPFWHLTGEISELARALIYLQMSMVEVADGPQITATERARWDRLLRARLPMILPAEVVASRYPARFEGERVATWGRHQARLVDDLNTKASDEASFRYFLLTLLLHEEVAERRFEVRARMPRLLPALAEIAAVPPAFIEPLGEDEP